MPALPEVVRRHAHGHMAAYSRLAVTAHGGLRARSRATRAHTHKITHTVTVSHTHTHTTTTVCTQVDLSKCFTDGQAYVALSRARTMEGLELAGFGPYSVRRNELVHR